MKLALAAGGVLLLVLLTWLLLRGIDTKVSAYAEIQRAFDEFALAEASIGRDVLQARAGLLGNYDTLVEAEDAMENALHRIRAGVEAESLNRKPVDRLAASVEQYEDLIERFKSANALLQNSLSYVGQLSTDPSFGALGDQFAPSATALAAAVLHLARDSSIESSRSLQEQIGRFEAQAPTDGQDGEAAHALLAHTRLLSDLLPEVEQALRAFVATPGRQPLEETREMLAHAQAGFELTAQRFRVLLYVASLGLLVIALRLGVRLWTRTLKIRRLVDANIIGIFIFDAEGNIVEANDTFLKIVGYDREALRAVRLRWADLTPAEGLDRDERCSPPEVKLTGSLQPTEKEYIRNDGSRVPVLVGAATFEDRGKEGVAFVLDLTPLKRAEAKARESERRQREMQIELTHANRLATMGQLTASIAHEVSQPVAATMTNAEAALLWLAREKPDLNAAQRAVTRVLKDGIRAREVIGRIRDLIKRAPPRMGRLEINEVMREVIEFTRSEAVKNRVSVRTELADGLPPVPGDRVQLQQVMLNLVINAIEAMSEGDGGARELLISTAKREEGGVLVAVRDSGPGLAPAAFECIFDAFYTTKPSGLGLGLSICRSIIETHGGRLWATANVPRGAVFQFTVPAGPEN
jgi:PAS domain S-box-containing protein